MAISRQQLAEEIASIPDDKLTDLFEIIHRYRLDLDARASNDGSERNSFAGIWADMVDEDFHGLLRDIEERRRNAFSNRPAR
jgi:hypothetical protein